MRALWAHWAQTGNPESSPPRHIFNLLTSAASFAKKGDIALGDWGSICPPYQPGPRPLHTATHVRGRKEWLRPPGLASQGDNGPAVQNTLTHTHCPVIVLFPACLRVSQKMWSRETKWETPLPYAVNVIPGNKCPPENSKVPANASRHIFILWPTSPWTGSSCSA